jgi:hypothetical protein
METFIQPITYSTEMTGAVPPQEMTQLDGDFAKVLTNHFQKGGGEKIDSNEKTAENPSSSRIANFLSGLMGSTPPALPEGNNNSSPDSAGSQSKKPSAGRSTSEPLPNLSSSLPLLGVPNEGQTQSINFDGRYASLFMGSTPPALPEGNNNSSPDSAEAQSKKPTAGLSTSEPLPNLSSSLPLPGVPNEGQTQSTNLTVKDGESITSPTVGEEINKEDKEKLPLQKESSSTTATWFSKILDPSSLTPDGVKSEKGEKTSLPQMGSRAPVVAPNSVPPEGASLPESQTQIPTSFSEGNLAGFLEGEGEGQEKVLWMGNESAQFPNGEGQKEIDSYETPPVLNEGSTQMPEEVGEVKENSSPAPLKSENPTVAQQVSQRAIWSIRNNEESVRITLDPPQLGHIYMVIERNKADIKTTLWTDNPATKATLETNQLQIQKIIESEGFKLEKFDVFVQQEKAGFQGSKDDPMNPNPQNRSSPSEIRAPLSGSPDPLPALARAVHPASKYLDLFV